MRIALLIVGLVALVFGLHWIGQGTGLFTWPSNPAMDNNPTFIYVGAATAVVGCALIFWSRRGRA